MNKNTEYYYQNALQMHLPVAYDSFTETMSLRLGRKNYFFIRSISPLNSYTSAEISKNKHAVCHLLSQSGFPVPKTCAIHSKEFEEGKLGEIISDLSFPLVVKPVDGGLGEHVLCNIQNMEQLKQYLIETLPEDDYLLIQEFHGNLQSYRVLVLNKKVIGVVLRHPSQVVGNGQHNLQELIDLTNLERQKISDALGPICVDTECNIRLAELGIDLNFIPKNGEQVVLGYTSNATRGGTYVSLGKRICKENERFFVRAAKVLDLSLVGFDVQCTDINVPIERSEGVIIEANHGPSVRIHEKPMAGTRVSVCKKILRRLIYRHPLAYLYTLYQTTHMVVYLRSGIALLIFYMFYKLVNFE
ncbi:MAG: UDP-N-acetylmuramyl peptide synthase [Legionella sp.]|nr:UDP-N-acetylmuramyl peptide synthase [Legionella sp.]